MIIIIIIVLSQVPFEGVSCMLHMPVTCLLTCVSFIHSFFLSLFITLSQLLGWSRMRAFWFITYSSIIQEYHRRQGSRYKILAKTNTFPNYRLDFDLFIPRPQVSFGLSQFSFDSCVQFPLGWNPLNPPPPKPSSEKIKVGVGDVYIVFVCLGYDIGEIEMDPWVLSPA